MSLGSLLIYPILAILSLVCIQGPLEFIISRISVVFGDIKKCFGRGLNGFEGRVLWRYSFFRWRMRGGCVGD